MAELIILGVMFVFCYTYKKRKAEEKYKRVSATIENWEKIKENSRRILEETNT